MPRVLITAIIILAVPCLLTGLFGVAFAAPDRDAPEWAVTQYLKAYMLKDRDIVPYMPADEKNLFGPYPFTGALNYSQPKVDDNQALVEFNAPVGYAKYPRHGAVLLFKYKEVWFVRQILFYDHIPRIFGLPSKSKTDEDRAYEPKVKELSVSYIEAWERGDLKKMRAIWFNWPELSRRRREENLSVQVQKIEVAKTCWNTHYASYTVKATYKYGILGYSMIIRGGMPLVKENDDWKVQGNQMVFDF